MQVLLTEDKDWKEEGGSTGGGGGGAATNAAARSSTNTGGGVTAWGGGGAATGFAACSGPSQLNSLLSSGALFCFLAQRQTKDKARRRLGRRY